MRPPTATGVCIRPMSMPPSCKAWACSALLISRSTTFTPGAWRRSSRSARGSVSNSAEVTSPTVSWPALPRAISRARCSAASMRATLTRASSTMASAAGVGAAPRRERSNRRTPRSFSMRPNAWLSAGCAMPTIQRRG